MNEMCPICKAGNNGVTKPTLHLIVWAKGSVRLDVNRCPDKLGARELKRKLDAGIRLFPDKNLVAGQERENIEK